MGVIKAAKQLIKAAARRYFDATADKTMSLTSSTWGLEYLPGGSLQWEGVPLEPLLKEFGSPLHVVSWPRLLRNVAAFQTVPSGCVLGCETYASYKTNPVPAVLAAMHTRDVGAEVISAYELWLAFRLGVAPKNIIYNGPVKTRASVEEAVRLGLGLLCANHLEELPVIAAVAKEQNKRPRVAVRISPPTGWSMQFGAPIATGAALKAVATSLGLSAQLDLVGLHAHRGGMIRSESELLEFVEPILHFTTTVADAHGKVFEVLDFGGSLGSPTVAQFDNNVDRWLNRTFFRDLPPPRPQEALSIERYLALLVEQVEAHFHKHGWKRPRIIIEPGRALTSNTQALLATVHSLKIDGDRTYAILDAGINLADVVRGEFHQLLRVTPAAPAAPDRVYTVVGPICTPSDWLYQAQHLPELNIGDVVAVMDAGAYFVPFSTSFSFPQPAIVGVESGKVHLVRRAETFDDLTRKDVF